MYEKPPPDETILLRRVVPFAGAADKYFRPRPPSPGLLRLTGL
jgi:hypothetical protein